MNALDDDQLIAIRRAKREHLIALGVDPYGGAYDVPGDIGHIVNAFEIGHMTSAAGRIIRHRDMGKLHFMDIWDMSGKIQVMIDEHELSELELKVLDLLDLADFIGVQGAYYQTKTGEKTIKAHSLTILCKTLRPIPKILK